MEIALVLPSVRVREYQAAVNSLNLPKNMNRNFKWLSSALLGLSLTGAVSNADTTNLVSLTTFESGQGLRYTYPYHYNWGFDWPGSTETFWADLEPPDYINSIGLFLFDSTLVAPFFPNPASGYGFGFGGGLNWDFDTTKLVGTNRDEYIVEFDCRVAGLTDTVTSGNGEFQIRFDAPDGTLGDPDGNPDTLVQLDYGFSAGSNWTHYVCSLDQATVDANGNWNQFLQYKSLITDIRFGCNWNQPDPAFGFDGDNQVLIDNIQFWAIDRVPVAPPPQVPFAIVDWNMDDKPLWYSWAAGTNGGWSENGVNATYLIEQPVPGAGVGGSNALMFWVLNDIYLTNSPLPSWGGGNGGFGGPGDYTYVNSGDLADYRLSMDARAEGLAPWMSAASFDFQTRFNTSTGLLVRVDTTFSNVSSNWTRVSALLSKGGIGEGSKAGFAAAYMLVTEVPLQIQLNNVTQSNLWQFDTDNKIFVDNVKLERLVLGCPPLRLTTSGTDVVVTWAQPSSGTSKLQSTSTPWTSASWADVIGATSPYTIPIASAPKYFRTKWLPPF